MFWSRFLIILFIVFQINGELPKQQDYVLNMRDSRCNPNEFDCFPDQLVPFCLPFDIVRDCIPDCPNAEDEKCGFNQTMCDLNIKRSNSMCGKCVNNEELDRFCVDRKWKNLCYEENVRQCATNSNCVHESWLNDGVDDCMDGSDELKCPTSTCNNETRPLIKDAYDVIDLHHLDHHHHLNHIHLHHNQTYEPESNEFPCDCADLMRKNPKANTTTPQKVYDSRCYQAGQCSFPVLCDFELFGGGWTVMMHRRWSSQVQFNRTWTDYKMGFGNMLAGEEFWLGNDRLHSLTFGRKCTNELIIRMRTARQGNIVMARYESIVLADEPDAYKLTLGPLLTENPLFSNIDGMILARDRPFVTWDRQQHFCKENHGGWWLPPDDCGQLALTSDIEAYRGHPGILWNNQRLIEITMLIRPRFYTPPLSGDNK